MTSTADASLQERILVLAPRGRDSELAERALRALSQVHVCRGAQDLLDELDVGVGVVLIAEEAFTPDLLRALDEGVAAQEPWSSVPFVVLTKPQRTRSYRALRSDPDVLAQLRGLGSVVALERPVRVHTLVGVVRVALESRKRQHVMRVLHGNADALNRGKDEFLAMLGHELRNPLGIARAALSRLQAGVGEGEQRLRYQDILERQLRAMTRMLDDILDVSRVSLGKLSLEGSELDLGELVQRTVDDLQPRALAAGQTLTLQMAAAPLRVRGDAVRLEQVVFNVVGNAIKYTPAGGTIQVDVRADDVDVIIRVVDDGIGIAPEMQARVFELFTQARTGAKQLDGGMGVGLALVDILVGMHGGRCELHSDGVGRGTRFTVYIPRVAVPVAPPIALLPRVEDDRALRVLLVEDDPDGRELLNELLLYSGYQVDVAASGTDGLEQARRAPPDVVITDLSLPGLDGYELARQVRRALSPAPFLVALTGHALPEDRRRTREAGFDVHLLKPVDFDALGQALAAATRRGSPS